MAIELRVLGSPEVLRGGVPLRLETRKALAILAYVALEGRQRRATFDGLLWPDSDAKRARSALRRTLSALRKALPDGALADGDDVALALTCRSDHDEVARLLEGVTSPPGAEDVDALGAADTLHRGRFLEGLTFRHAAPFEEWRAAVEEQMRRRHASILERLCQALISAGELEAATDTAGRRLQVDPLHEPSHQQLMLLHTWRGDRTAATEQYRTCVRVLDRELGVAPLEKTTSLYRAILAGAVPAPAAPVSATRTARDRAPDALPFVGREAELDALRDTLVRAGDGDDGVAGVTGEAGIGKTRLVLELAHDVPDDTVAMLTVHEGDRTIAYAPVVALLRQLGLERRALPAARRRELARLLPELADGDGAPPVTGPSGLARMIDAVVTTILDELGRGPDTGLLVVDDAHRADGESLDLLAQLIARAHEAKLLIVLTWRTGAEGATTVERLLPAGATVVRPTRLELEAVEALASAAGRPDDAEPLFTESEGVPYLVVSYLAARHVDDGSWDLPPPGRELVRARLARVTEVAGQVLSAAAVLGRSVALDTLVQVSGRSELEVVDAVDELTARAILAERAGPDGDPTYAFTHDKLRAVVYDDASLARRRLLHARAADALARTPGTPAAALAHHLSAAGREQDAAAAHSEAGRAAAALYANAEAVDHLEAAIALGQPDTGALLVQLGDALLRLGRYADAGDRYTRAASRAADPALVEHRLGQLRLREGDHTGARTHLDRAVRAPATPARHARVHADLALSYLQDGQLDTAATHAATALSLATGSGDARALARARNLLGVLGRRTGDIESARTHLLAGLQAADGDLESRAASLNNLALVLRDAGDHDAAIVTAEEALAAGRDLGDRHREAALLNNLADLLHAGGRTDEALAVQREAAERFAGVGTDAVTTPEIWQLIDW